MTGQQAKPRVMWLRRLAPPVAAGWHGEDGISTVEFALVAPILLLIMAGVVDFGGALRAKFELSSAVSASANYALLNADKVTSAGGSNLAGTLAGITASSLSNQEGNIEIVINHGAALSVANGVSTTSGTSANADKCYCPTGSGGSLTWGAVAACASACPSGALAGKFITIQVSKPYSPLFGSYGIVGDGGITVRTVVKPL